MIDVKKLVSDLPADPVQALEKLLALVDVWLDADDGGSRESLGDAQILSKLLETYSQHVGIPTTIEVARQAVAIGSNVNPGAVNDIVALRQLSDQIGESLVGKKLSIQLDAIESIIPKKIAEQYIENDGTSFGIGILNSSEKDRIHEILSNLRGIIGSSDVTERKKNALLARINDLAHEVDRAGTRTETAMAFVADLGFVFSELGTKAKPVLEEAKEMLRIVFGARERTEGVLLPKPEDFPMLPPPKGL